MKKLLVITVLLFVARMDAFGQWVQTNGPYGGGILCFGKHNNDLFAGSTNGNADGLIFRSTNNGLSWAQTSFLEPQIQVVSIISIGTNIIAVTASGIYLSSDDGTQWNLSDSGLTFPNVGCVAVLGAIVFAGTSEGVIYRSFDSGRSWHPNGNGLKSGGLTEFCVMGSKIMVESTQGIYFSTDSGANWQGPTNNSERLFATQGSKLFALCDTGIVVSIDTGSSWMIVDTTLLRKDINSIVVADSNIFVGTYLGVFISTDEGESWQAIDTGLTDRRVQSLTVSGSTILAGSESQGVFQSTNNGLSWIQAGVPEFESSYLASVGSYLFSDEDGYIPFFISSNGGDSWTEHTDAAAGTIVSIGTSIIAANNNNCPVVFVSTDSGTTWTPSNPISSSYGVRALAVIDSNLFALTDIGIFLSTDIGSSWTDVSTSLDLSNMNNWTYTMVSINGNLFAAGFHLYFSSDLGADWVDLKSAVISPLSEYFNPAFVQCGSYLFATTYGAVIRSSDNGQSWVRTDTGLADTIVNALAVYGNYIFAGTIGNGVSMSRDFGENWTKINAGLSDSDIFALTIIDSTLYAGTGSSGVWRRSLSDLPALSYDLDVKGTEQDTIFFDTIPVGQTSLRSVTEFNAGNAPLSIQPVQAPQNDFVTSDLSSSVVLDSGESSTFEVYFQPTTPGLHLAELNLQSEAREVTIYLSGFATGQADVKNSILQNDLLLTAYPNPLTQSTIIQFTSPESGVARVTVVNLLGEEVARVFDGTLSAGEHSFTWNAGTMPAGMYECIVDMNGSVQQTPVMISR